MTTGTALVLLGFGLGTLLMADQSSPRSSPRAAAESHADELRARVIEAQKISAAASQRARELAALWSRAEDASRKERS